MAKRSDTFLLHDIKVKPYSGSNAYRWALTSPILGGLLYVKSLELVRLYQARVGKKTGRLAESANAKVRIGGQTRDRLVGVVSINDESVRSSWRGKPFYYGVFHEAGTDGALSGGSRQENGRIYRGGSKAARRRKADGPRGPKPGYHELRSSARQWRGGP